MSDTALESLEKLYELLQEVQLIPEAPVLDPARSGKEEAELRLSSHVIPRFRDLDAPLVAVVGGSTGAGKSTLVNSLVKSTVVRASALRPTTRRPVLLHHPQDELWFAGQRFLPTYERIRLAADDPPSQVDAPQKNVLEIRSHPGIPRGLAIIDSPDIDSREAANRELAHQLLQVADLWLFTTTAARYADAVPWSLLQAAGKNNTVIGVLLNRVPSGSVLEIRNDFESRLAKVGITGVPLFVVLEEKLGEDGFLSETDVAPIRQWLEGLCGDLMMRTAIGRQALFGAVQTTVAATRRVEQGLADQDDLFTRAQSVVDESASRVSERVEEMLLDGTLLRGEVLARWQDIVGGAKIWQQAQKWIARSRDSLAGLIKGQKPKVEPVNEALEESLRTVIASGVTEMYDNVESAWLADLDMQAFAADISAPNVDSLQAEVDSTVTEWSDSLTQMIKAQGNDKRRQARILSAGVNLLGAALMLVIFAATAGVTGTELGVGAAAAAAAQKLLELVFGDEAVRQMAEAGKQDLLKRVEEIITEHRQELDQIIPEPSDGKLCQNLSKAADQVQEEWNE